MTDLSNKLTARLNCPAGCGAEPSLCLYACVCLPFLSVSVVVTHVMCRIANTSRAQTPRGTWPSGRRPLLEATGHVDQTRTHTHFHTHTVHTCCLSQITRTIRSFKRIQGCWTWISCTWWLLIHSKLANRNTHAWRTQLSLRRLHEQVSEPVSLKYCRLFTLQCKASWGDYCCEQCVTFYPAYPLNKSVPKQYLPAY